jgi:hypothetical protein
MSNGSTEIKLEIVKGVFELLRTWWVVLALVVGTGMYTGVLTQENVLLVMNKVVKAVETVMQR